MMKKLKVKIENLDQIVEVEPGQDLRSALLDSKVTLYRPTFLHTHLLNCHGKGLCGTCQIEIVEGEEGMSDPSFVERLHPLVPKGHRLSCQTRVYRDSVIRTLFQPKPVDY